jgi:hypothetical protein
LIERLHWRYGEHVPIETAKVPESIARAPEEAVFFCDNSVFDKEFDPAITEALLAVPGRMVLTPFVMAPGHPGRCQQKASAGKQLNRSGTLAGMASQPLASPAALQISTVV